MAAEPKPEKRWLLDYEIEKATAGRISASRLRKDRIGAQLFPFHRLGRSVFYDLGEVNAAIEAARFGGKVPQQHRQQRKATA